MFLMTNRPSRGGYLINLYAMPHCFSNKENHRISHESAPPFTRPYRAELENSNMASFQTNMQTRKTDFPFDAALNCVLIL
jgi:hypothetical protein